ncbi:MAG TPA: flagellar export chaperone FliS [Bryobacteraceae bacterium]|nr:flagellar export chaperone FliS [Bryobacteraceae bacterium]
MSHYEQYLEGSVLSASPIELVRMLYRFVIDNLADACRCTDAKDIEGRGRAVSKATEGIVELLSSLDHSQGGEVSSSLGELYGYCASRVLQGHIDQDKSPFEEVQNLMSTMLQGWEQIGADVASPAALYEPTPSSYEPINASY